MPEYYTAKTLFNSKPGPRKARTQTLCCALRRGERQINEKLRTVSLEQHSAGWKKHGIRKNSMHNSIFTGRSQGGIRARLLLAEHARRQRNNKNEKCF
jgi:hypothetical protein